mmetsp:Transcript_1709/g.3843  ORF Transcript_1709/g.3843 Transcript_1709/m.3843 type:complete len:233 (-) Transcript_1709:1088-1786(-)
MQRHPSMQLQARNLQLLQRMASNPQARSTRCCSHLPRPHRPMRAPSQPLEKKAVQAARSNRKWLRQQQQQQQQPPSPSHHLPQPANLQATQLQLNDDAAAVASASLSPGTTAATSSAAAAAELSPQNVASAAAAVLGDQSPGSGDLEWDAYALLDAAVAAPDFLNFRPSVTAAAVLYAARTRAGELPLWPSSLAAVTGTRTSAGSSGGSGSSRRGRRGGQWWKRQGEQQQRR